MAGHDYLSTHHLQFYDALSQNNKVERGERSKKEQERRDGKTRKNEKKEKEKKRPPW